METLIKELGEKAVHIAQTNGALFMQREVLRWAVENRDALRQPTIDSLIERLEKLVEQVRAQGLKP